MATDIKDQIHTLMETGIHPVSVRDIASRDRAKPAPFPSRKAVPFRRVTTGAVTLAAAGCAAGLIATQLADAPPARTAGHAPAALTAAYVRHLAAASRLALAQSGQAVLTTTLTQGGQLQQISTDHLTFSGANWNDSFTYTATVDGKMLAPESAVNRVVDGQAYDYFAAADGLAWYHVTGPDAVASLNIPDPRTLLSELEPAADFVRIGAAIVDGVQVEHLRATSLAGLAVIALPFVQAGGQVTALDVWVDRAGVVRQLSVSVSRQVTVVALRSESSPKVVHLTTPGQQAAPQLVPTANPARKQAALNAAGDSADAQTETQTTTSTVTFLDIGQPQVITAPTNAIPVDGRG
jgi:hypothetical protein